VLHVDICGNIYQIQICIGFFFLTYTSNLVLTFKILAVKEHLKCPISLAERLRAPFNYILKSPCNVKGGCLASVQSDLTLGSRHYYINRLVVTAPHHCCMEMHGCLAS